MELSDILSQLEDLEHELSKFTGTEKEKECAENVQSIISDAICELVSFISNEEE